MRAKLLLLFAAALAGCASYTGPKDDAPIILGPRDRAWLSPREIERAQCLVGHLSCQMGSPNTDKFCWCTRPLGSRP